jgi:hypothetical protein
MVKVPFNHEWVGIVEQEQHALRYREEEWRTIFPGKEKPLVVTYAYFADTDEHYR